MSARSVIEHALTVYYADSPDPKHVVDTLLTQLDDAHRAEVLRESVYEMQREPLGVGPRLLRMADEADEKATAPAASATPDFFQTGHTYQARYGRIFQFQCEHVTTRPGTSDPIAFGFLRRVGDGPDWRAGSRTAGAWESGKWTDITNTTRKDGNQ